MTDPRETHFTGAEGECKNSQAKRSDPDDTSERTAKRPDTKGSQRRVRTGISQVMTEAERHCLSVSFLLFTDLLHERGDPLHTEKI